MSRISVIKNSFFCEHLCSPDKNSALFIFQCTISGTEVPSPLLPRRCSSAPVLGNFLILAYLRRFVKCFFRFFISFFSTPAPLSDSLIILPYFLYFVNTLFSSFLCPLSVTLYLVYLPPSHYLYFVLV